MSSAVVAQADVLTSDVGGTVVNVAPGGSVTVPYALTPTSTPTGDRPGCNVTGKEAERGTLTVTSTPAASAASGLTIDTPVRELQNCSKNIQLTFTVANNVKNGTQFAIASSVTGGLPGAVYSSTADFTLRVVGGLTATTTSIAPATTTVAYGTPQLTLTGTLRSLTPTQQVPVAGKTIDFKINGMTVGSGVTNALGVATVPAPIGTAYPVTGAPVETLASFAGDATHATSTALGALTITRGAQAPLVITAPAAGSFGQVLSLTSSGGSGTGATTYTASGACSLEPSGTSVRITSGTGTCTLGASKLADANYGPVSAAPMVFSVGKASQDALTVTAPGTGTFGDLLSVITSGGSGTGAVDFSVGTSTACAKQAGKLSVTSGTGTCVIVATKAADDDYAATSSAAHTVAVGKAARSLVITSPAVAAFGDADQVIAYSASDTVAEVTFGTGDSTACSVVAGKLHITSGTGTCVLTAAQAETADHSGTTSAAHPVTVQKGAASLSLSDLSPTYDGQPQPVTVTTTPASLSGVTVTYDGSPTAPTRAGTYDVVASLSSPDYQADTVTGTLIIAKKALTGAITAGQKEYDGTNAATVSPVALDGVVSGDALTLVATNGRFASHAAGLGEVVTADLALTGASAADYALAASTATTTADVTPRRLTGSIVANDKVYDRTTAATLSATTVDRTIPLDDLLVVASNIAFDAASAGPRTVTATLALTGADASNYVLISDTATDTAVINQLALTGSITATGKVYNGLLTAAVAPSITGVLTGDDVKVTAAGALFADKHVGTGKAVTASLGLGGSDAGNYSLAPGPYSATADITPRDLTGSFTAGDKVYDGTTVAPVLTKVLADEIAGDDVQLSLTAEFADKNVGNDKAVSAVGPDLAGQDRLNYRLGTVPGTSADITVKPVTGTITAADKVYDGTTTAAVSPLNPVDGVLAGDVATLTAGNGRFADPNVGTTPVTATVALTGAGAGNYVLTSATATTRASITPAPLTITASSHALKASAALPTIAPAYSAFVNGETPAVLTTAPTCSSTYAVGAVGSFPSTCSGAAASNYAITYVNGLVSVTYTWSGFFQPIDALANHSNGRDSAVVAGTIFNRVKAGSTVPVKFSLNGDRGLSVFEAGFPKAVAVACGSAGTFDDLEELSASPTSVLKYDATAGQYVYSWKTLTTYAGTCQRFQVKLADGTSHYAFFSFTK